MFNFFSQLRFGVNELLWLSYLILNFTAVVLAYRFWGKGGLLSVVPLSIVLANIQVGKLMTLFGFDGITMGNIAYGGIYLASDILTENEGKHYSRKVVSLGFAAMLFTTFIMQIVLKVKVSPGDKMQGALSAVFGFMPRLAISSVCGFAVSQSFDIWSYQFIRKFRPSYRDIWIRNNASTMISQILDNIVFSFLAFTGKYPLQTVIGIIFSTYLLKIVISLLDTPFVYIATLWKKQGKISD